MAEITLDEHRIEELVDKAVEKRLKLTFEDMEEVRKSPAAAIVRVETRLDALEARIERDMLTKADFAEFKQENESRFGSLDARIESRFGSVDSRIAKLEASSKLVIAFNLIMLAMLGAMLAKMFLLP